MTVGQLAEHMKFQPIIGIFHQELFQNEKKEIYFMTSSPLVNSSQKQILTFG